MYKTVETIAPEKISSSSSAEVILERGERIRAAFVTNLCAHYRVRTFEMLARIYDLEFYFYSAGNEWYWQQNHGIRAGSFRHTYLRGFHLTKQFRVVPSLITKLWQQNPDVYIKCINGRFALPVTYLMARLRRRPFVLWTGIWMSLETRFHRMAFPLALWIYRNADAIVVYGEHVKRYLVSLNVAPERIFVAHHAVDNSQYDRNICEAEKAALRERLGLHGRRVVLYLGRLEREKGVEDLIQAFALLKEENASLVLVGNGSMRQSLVALGTELGLLGRTRFVGYIAPEEALIYYAIADCLVLPSVTTPNGKEPWGLVVNEAMNQGTPVIATEAVGAAAGSLVQHGVNGFIVPERDSVALAQAMDRMLTNAKLRNQMSENARRIIASWDNERMVQGFRHAIEYALRRNGALER